MTGHIQSFFVAPDITSALGLIIGLAGITGFTIDLKTLRGRRSGHRVQQDAIDELARRIEALANGTIQLLTPDHVRSLAMAIERERQCPVITDTLIAEAVRAALLAVERNYRGAPLERRVQKLNCLILELGGPPLLSIAATDRLEAYIRSQPIAVGLLFGGVAITAWLAIIRASALFLSISVGLLAVELLFLYAAVRAERFWSQDGRKTPRTKIDFLFTALTSRSGWAERFWLFWASIWEIPYILGMFQKHFLISHEFRFREARRLASKLRRIQRERDMAKYHGLPAPDDSCLFRALCERLWSVTGDRRFLTIAERGELRREDTMDYGIARL